MKFPESKPFVKLVPGDVITFTELFNGVQSGKEFTKDTQDKEQTVGGIRDDNVRENGMCMLTAVTEYPEDTQIGFILSAVLEVNDGSAIVIVDVTVSGTSTDRTGLQFRPKVLYVGVKKRF